MSEAHTALWTKLDAMELDDPSASLPFSRRLARENGWSHAFALRVVNEYKRFVFLAVAAGHPVTPSEEIDQAWHLHMVYTRSYWHDLCRDTLGQPLHHGPTRGGAQEGEKFDGWYARTLDSYRRLFSEEPPTDIWPAAAIRFGHAPHYRRVNTAANWVIPKRPAVATAGIGGVGLVLAGCVGLAQTTSANKADWTTFLIVGGFIVLIAIVIALLKRFGKRGGGGGGVGGTGGLFGCGSGCGGGGCGGGCGGG